MNKETQKQLLEIVSRNYEEIAAEFDQTRKKILWPELFKLAEMVKDGDSVLDAGCGNGRLASAFKAKNVKYVGIDSSQKLIEAARRNFEVSEFKVKCSKLKVGNILELDEIEEDDFDYVFCIAVLQHLPGQDLQIKALEQMKNKLAPSGKIVLTNWNLWRRKKYLKIIFKYIWLKLICKNEMDFGDVLFDWKKGRFSQRYYHAFTKCELKKIAKKAGLKIEKMYKDKYNYYLILKK